jgi:hypothetical protein
MVTEAGSARASEKAETAKQSDIFMMIPLGLARTISA